MNRPFYAIGVLLAFLAVAMMAVGLSSRPTSKPASVSSGSGITKPRRGPGSPVFLLAVPDEVADESAEQQLVADESNPAASYAESCGLDRTTGIVYVPQYLSRDGLKPTVVEVTSEPEPLAALGPMDCHSYCDPAYDAAVYGVEDPNSHEFGYPASGLNSGEFSYQEDATLLLFRSLLGEQFEARSIRLPRAKSAGRNWRYELNVWISGAANQATRSAERLGLADEWERWSSLAGLASGQAEALAQLPSWSDYQDWSNSEQGAVAAQDTPAGGGVAISSHPWRQVLHIAVASLNHAAKTLGAAAERLDALDAPQGDGPIGLRSTEYQPR